MKSGKVSIFFDVIVDLSYHDLGIKKNIEHWENAMRKSNRKYILAPRDFFVK